MSRPAVKTVFLIAAVALAWVQCPGQDIAFTPENFPGKTNELKNALAEINQGDELFYLQNTLGEDAPLYSLAFLHYEKAHRFNPQNALLNFKLGVCYLNSSSKYKAHEFLERAFRLNAGVDPMIHYELGRSFHINSEWDKAIAGYNMYWLSTVNEEKRKTALKRIEECNNGKELEKHPVNVKIENLGAGINSRYPDYTPLIPADESFLIFTSRREDTFGNDVDGRDQEFFEDIYKSERTGSSWHRAVNLGQPVNTKTHDAGAGLSADGHTMFVFKGDRNAGDILISKYVTGSWTKPEDAGQNINTKFHESAACLSPDGNTLYFVSDKPGGFGGRDIYRSRWNETKSIWDVAENLGGVINSAYDEEGVFLHPDGRTLYFASKAHTCMGGYDIFYSTYENNVWAKPLNIGYPVNTPDDDLFFVLSASGDHGYFSSFRKEGFGDKDIYKVTFAGKAKPAIRMSVLKGVVTNSVTKEPLAASIELIDLEKNEHIGNFNTDSKTGKYIISLPSGRNYGAVIYSDGYLFESDHFEIPDTASFSEITRNTEMKPIGEGNNIILTNIFFDSGKSQLRNESMNILDRMVKLLKDFPAWKIEISGHTDNTGNAELNRKLSENRAKAVVDYLVQKGIQQNRLTYTGYGASKPFVANDSETSRQKNRRIEFKITAK